MSWATSQAEEIWENYAEGASDELEFNLLGNEEEGWSFTIPDSHTGRKLLISVIEVK